MMEPNYLAGCHQEWHYDRRARIGAAFSGARASSGHGG